MKLKRVRTLAPVTLKGRVPAELYEILAAYAGCYREVHGEAVDLWPFSSKYSVRSWTRTVSSARGGGRQVEAQAAPRRGPKTGPDWSRGMVRNGTGVVLLQDKEQFRTSQNPAISRDNVRNSRDSGCSTFRRRR
jgi:hypothetical protein